MEDRWTAMSMMVVVHSQLVEQASHSSSVVQTVRKCSVMSGSVRNSDVHQVAHSCLEPESTNYSFYATLNSEEGLVCLRKYFG